MKKPDFDKLKKQAEEIKKKATELGSEAAKAAGGLKRGMQTGLGVSRSVVEKAGEVITKDKISSGIDTVAKGTEFAGRSLTKASSNLKKLSKKLKGEK